MSQFANIRVAVTPANIRNGTPDSVNRDAVSLALGRYIEKRNYAVDTCSDAVVITNRKTGKEYEARLPKHAGTFLARFDKGDKSVKPFEFVLRGVPVKALVKGVQPMSLCHEFDDTESDSCQQKCSECPGCK